MGFESFEMGAVRVSFINGRYRIDYITSPLATKALIKDIEEQEPRSAIEESEPNQK